MNAKPIKELREMDRSALVAMHDETAKNTVVGTGAIVEELNRRDREAHERQILAKTNQVLFLSIASVIVAVASVIIAAIK